MQVKTEELEVDKKSACSKKSPTSPVSPSSAVPAPNAHITAATTATTADPVSGEPTLYNPEIELSTDTEDSSSDVAGETGKAVDSFLNFIENVRTCH